MKTILLSSLLVLSTLSYGKKWTITSSGNTFSPTTVTIDIGDTVIFNIGAYHNAVEVSESTWNSNGNFQVPGISVPYGGGLVLPAKLTAGTHYYVCTPHAMYGMKGQIIVQNTTGISENEIAETVSVYPNPAKENIHVKFIGKTEPAIFKLYDSTGRMLLQREILTDDDIPVNHLNRGLFLYSFQHEGETTKGKLILE
ncbi:MAG TPA: T9SS type A sorting domain-containing protein [Flavobacterium sp.]|nr:T9SS type A sorting domain-containing protein [Flavobacterium sp.]